MEQNSSDLGNEEWETASESSDVLTYRDSKAEEEPSSREVVAENRRDVRKSFSSQRPSGERQNRSGNYGGYGNGGEDRSSGKTAGNGSGRGNIGSNNNNSRGVRPGTGSNYRDHQETSVQPESTTQGSSTAQIK